MSASTQEEFPVLPINPFPLEDLPPKKNDDEPDKSFRESWDYWTGPQSEGKCEHGWLYMLGHYFFFFLEFLLHHFFVLSGSMRIYLICLFLLAGGTFYAVAPTVLLGSVFFFTAIMISLALANFSRTINERVDREDREKQRAIHAVNERYQLIEDKKHQASILQSSNTPDSQLSSAHDPWTPIENMQNSNFSWLNYKDVLNLAKSKYIFVIYFMDIVVVIAAVWNITEEILRWQAVLPFASVLTAMGPFWIIFTLSVLAALCLGLKMAYTHPITQLRTKNVELLQRTRETFEGVLKHNPVLRQALNEIETELKNNKKNRSADDERAESKLESRQLLAKTEQSKSDDPSPVKTRQLAFAISSLISAGLTFAIYTALPATVPLWSIIAFSVLCFAMLCYTGYRFLQALIVTYKIKTDKTFLQRFREWIESVKASFESEFVLEDLQANYKTKAEKEAEKAKGKPKEPLTFWQRLGAYWKIFLSLGVSAVVTIALHAAIASMPLLPMMGILTLSMIVMTWLTYKLVKLVMHYYEARIKNQTKEKTEASDKRERIQNEVAQQLKGAGAYTDEEIAKLTCLAYSLWKLKNMHRFKPQRNFIDSVLDNIGVPLWNAAVTILPTFFIINGICFYIFLMPSVLSCWPLFLIELVPAIILAIDFGWRKLGDNKHDLIKDAAALIIDEITNPKNGTLTACTKEGITLERLGLKTPIQKEAKQQGGGEKSAPASDLNKGRNEEQAVSIKLRNQHDVLSAHPGASSLENSTGDGDSPKDLASIPLLSPITS